MAIVPEWDRNTRTPCPVPPRLSCDAQIHIYGDTSAYPVHAKPRYPIPFASFADSRAMHRMLGFERTVIVQPMVYGHDHSLLIDTIAGTADKSKLRATAIVDDSTPDKDIYLLHAVGVRSARLNISRQFGTPPTSAQMRRTLERIREVGWLARLHVREGDLVEHSSLLRSMQDLIFVIDHMGHVDFAKGLEGSSFRWIIDSLKEENWWMMISNGNRISSMDAAWDDAIPFGRALADAAPDRLVWGSDWPHVDWQKRMMNDAEEVELFYRYVDYDDALIRRILVENPACLFGFS